MHCLERNYGVFGFSSALADSSMPAELVLVTLPDKPRDQAELTEVDLIVLRLRCAAELARPDAKVS